jgi:hypothetical protein
MKAASAAGFSRRHHTRLVPTPKTTVKGPPPIARAVVRQRREKNVGYPSCGMWRARQSGFSGVNLGHPLLSGLVVERVGVPHAFRIGDAEGEVRGRRLCGVPSEREKVLPGGFPGLHPGLVCDAPLGHVRGLQNKGHPQSQVSVNLGHPLLSGLWSKEWVSHMPMRPATRPAIEWVSHMRPFFCSCGSLTPVVAPNVSPNDF